MNDPNPSDQNPVETWTQLAREWARFGTFPKPPPGEGPGNPVAEWTQLGQEWMAEWVQLNPFVKLFPFNPLEMTRALAQVGSELAQNPAQAQTEWIKLVGRQIEVVTQMTRQAWGIEHENVVEPDRRDRRFQDEAWNTNPVYNAVKQSYLLNYEWFLNRIESNESLSPRERRRVSFYLRQFLDSISPSNVPLLNPAVVRETLETGGGNLLSGMENLSGDLSAGRVKMVEGSGFELGVNVAASKGRVVLRTRILELIQYEPTTNQVHARPILFFPPWINKVYILDLQPKNSMVRYLTDQGFTVFMASWKNPDESYADFGMEDYVTEGIVPALEAATSISGSPDVNAVGYCIGGTLLSIAMAALRAKGDTRIHTTTFLVSLQDFAEPGDLGVFIDEEQIEALDRRMAKKGYLEASEMATTMNLLRSNDLIWNYVINNYYLGRKPMAFDLLYWNADSTRMPRKMHRYYLRNMYISNNLVKPGKLRFLGEAIDLGKIDQEIYSVGTMEDHIVPWQSAFRTRRHVSGPVRFVLATSGHIAGIVNPPGKGSHLTNDDPTTDPEAWLAGAEKHAGSWWGDWTSWLGERSGKRVKPPLLGNEEYPALEPAPGTYVRETGGDATYPAADAALGVEESPSTYAKA